MGLAPYGKPTFMDAMRKIVRLVPDGSFELDLVYFRHHKEQTAYQWTDGSPEFDDLFASVARGIAGSCRAGLTIRSKTDIATSHARSRRCTRRHSFI